MNLRSFTILAMIALFAMSSVAVAGHHEVTLEGKIVCAKCALKEEGRDKCQNVLVVEKDDKAMHYYLASNKVADEMGYVCTATKSVQITGTVSEKDGKMWLAATKVAMGDEG